MPTLVMQTRLTGFNLVFRALTGVATFIPENIQWAPGCPISNEQDLVKQNL